MNGENPLWWLVLPGALGLGLLFLRMFAVLVSGDSAGKVERLQEEHYTAEQKRTDEKIALLNQIRGLPEHQRGPLYEKYDELDRIDRELTYRGQMAIVDAKTVIDEKTWQELEDGISPYPKPERESPAVLKKRAWRGW